MSPLGPSCQHIGDTSNCHWTISQRSILYFLYTITYNFFVGLGKTVSDIDISKARGVFEKTKFSMVVPEVEAVFESEPTRKSVVLFGIEVI